MPIPSYPEFFNDVFGPIMQPGSSSHTAGPCRIGFLARSLLGEQPREIHVLLDANGSFAGTFGIMAEDRGMIAGVLGFLPDDERLFDAFAIADQAGIAYHFEFGELSESQHPNAVKFTLTGESGHVVTLVADSTGGGMIETRVVDGYPLRTKGDAYVLLVFDPNPAPTLHVATFVTAVSGLPGLVEVGASTTGGQPESGESGQSTTRFSGRGTLHWVRLAEPPDPDAIRRKLPGFRVAVLDPILPVLDRTGRKPQLFDTMVRWREVAAERGLSLAETAIQYEVDASGWSSEQVVDYMRMIERAMYRQTHAVYEEQVVVPTTPFRPNTTADWVAAHGLATPSDRRRDRADAQMGAWRGRGHTGRAGGTPGRWAAAAATSTRRCGRLRKRTASAMTICLRGLFVAAGIGAIAYTRTAPTGEVTGCTGETGICGAMAAAGIAEMAGGTPEQVENAASLLLQAVIGMPCDPIVGGAGQPCRSRVLTTTCMAHVFADLALAGRDAILPLHEVIDVVDQVGRSLPPGLLCTGRAGAAATPTAQRKAIAFREWFDMTVREGIRRPPGNLI